MQSATQSAAPTRSVTLLVVSTCALLLSPTLTYRMGLDQGAFAYMADGLLDGRWPYIETWDHQFPGLMALQAVEILALGRSVAMFRAFDLVYQVVNAYLIYRIARVVAGSAGGYLAAAVFALIYQGYGPWNTAQRESFGLLFVLMGLWLYVTVDRRRPIVTAIGVGLGLGLAALVKPTLLALGALYLPLAPRLRRAHLSLVAACLAAVVIPAAVVLACYWGLDALQDLYEATIAYQVQVYGPRLRGEGPLWEFWLSKLGRLGGKAVAIGLAFVPFLAVTSHRRLRWMLYLGYLGSIYAVWVQGTFAGYHYLPGLGLGAILIGIMFGDLIDRSAQMPGLRRSRVTAGSRLLVAQLAILVALPLYVDGRRVGDLVSLRFLERPRVDEFRNQTVFDFTESYRLAEYARTRTAPTDRIQVWGHESLVYYLARRVAASRFQTSNPLVTRVPGQEISAMQRRWRQEFMRDLRARRPSLIAVVREDNWWWAPGERTSEQLLADFPELESFIARDYVPDREIGRFLVYRPASLEPASR